MSRMPLRLAARGTWLCLALGAACQRAPAIVHSGAPAWGSASPWVVGATARHVVGGATGDEGFAVSGAARLADGRFVIGIGGLNEVRMYGPNGALQHSFGGTGIRPGQFRAIGPIRVRGDTIVVVSLLDSRLEMFDDRGALLRSVALQPPLGLVAVAPFAQLDDGSILAWASEPGPPLPVAGTTLQDTIDILRYALSGELRARLARLPGPKQLVTDADGGVRQVAMPFALRPAAAAVRGEVLTGSGDQPAVAVRDSTGRVRRVYAWTAPRMAVDSALRARFRGLAGEAPGVPLPDNVARILDAMRFPDTLPVWQALLVDDDGAIWVDTYQPPWQDDSQWTVLDGEGRWLGSVRLPPAFQPTQIGHDFVLGLLSDDTGRHAVWFTLTRGVSVSTH